MKYLLLHGLGQSSASWKDVVEAMDGSPDIFCPNLSDWLCHKEASYAVLYQALEEYCSQFDDSLNLCGLSLGGVLALQYTIEHPERVNSLVLIGTQYQMPKKLLKLQNAIFHMMPESAFQKMGFGKKDFINLCKSMMELDFQRDLNQIGCRVLVLCGEKDKANREAAMQLREQIPKAKIKIIKNAGHEVNTDNPAALGRVLSAFYEKQTNRKQKMFREMRRRKQEITKEECARILKTEKRGVLAVIGDGGYPYAVPLNFYYDENEETIYFHCAGEGHKLDAMKRCDKVCFTVWNQGTKKEGDWAYFATSVVAMGRAELVTEDAVISEKIRALGLKYYPTEAEVEEEMKKSLDRVQLVAICIEHMTGKLVHEK